LTIASAALSLSLLSKENIDYDALLLPLHSIVPVDLYKTSRGKGYFHHSVLIVSGTTYNLISKAMADKLRLEAAIARKR
jgi:hypothetical protein